MSEIRGANSGRCADRVAAMRGWYHLNTINGRGDERPFQRLVPTPMESHQHEHDHQVVPSDPALRTKALESLLVEKGLVDPAALDALVDRYEHKVGPRNGARVVARAWVDPAYKKRLLTDPLSALAELGYMGGQGEHMLVVENGPRVHNLVVC